MTLLPSRTCSSEAKCTTATCSSALVGVYQRYAGDPTVYFVCRDAVAANALVAACPPNLTVDTATGDCVLTCLAEGRLADRDNASRYYECLQTGANVFSGPVLLVCPPGSTFSADRQRCLTGNEGSSASSAEDTKAYSECGACLLPSCPLSAQFHLAFQTRTTTHPTPACPSRSTTSPPSSWWAPPPLPTRWRARGTSQVSHIVLCV